MATRTKVIGPISAYAIAVANGYTGTEEQFATQIANASANAARAEAAADHADAVTASLPADFYDVEKNFAPLYANLTFPVSAGQHCVYNGIYYAANTDIATSEAWTAAHWTRVNVGDEVNDLKSAINGTTVSDMFDSNAAVAKTWKTNTTASWSAANKRLSVTMTESQLSADTYRVSMSPKFTSGHKYKIAVKYTLEESHYITITNVGSLSNFNTKQDILSNVSKSSGTIDVFTLTASMDGWLTLAVYISANTQQNWAFDIAVYDVTGIDLTSVSDDIFSDFPDSCSFSGIESRLASLESDVSELESDVDADEEDIAELTTDLHNMYAEVVASDMYGSNGEVAKTWKTNTTASWSTSNKRLSVTMTESQSSADTYRVSMSPKFVNGHTYKIAVKYTLEESHYITITNVGSLSNFNTKQDILSNANRSNGASDVFTITASMDGWLTLAVYIGANTTQNWAFDIAVYDVTGKTVTVADSAFLEMSDSVVISYSGVVADIKGKSDYDYAMISNMKGKSASALGDSLTATGSGSYYLTYVKDRIGLSSYANCGIGGTLVSGAENSNAMYQDTRINSLASGSQIVTVMGGTNDIWQEYYKDHPGTNLTGWGDVTRENHDVSTFCGAYNVMISKILYRFSKVAGYYNDVTYTGVTQETTAVDDFRLILITPPQCYYASGDTITAATKEAGITKAHELVKKIADLWGLPCVDSWEMGMNDMNKSLWFSSPSTDATHFNAAAHERLASLIIDKMIQVSRYS